MQFAGQVAMFVLFLLGFLATAFFARLCYCMCE